MAESEKRLRADVIRRLEARAAEAAKRGDRATAEKFKRGAADIRKGDHGGNGIWEVIRMLNER